MSSSSSSLFSSHNSYPGAPLPSPSARTASQQFSWPPPRPRGPPQQPEQPPPVQPHFAQQQPSSGQAAPLAASDDTSSLLRNDMSLVAEAARRAQMAVLMRDMGDVVL